MLLPIACSPSLPTRWATINWRSLAVVDIVMSYADLFFEVLLLASIVCLIGWPVMLAVALVQCLRETKHDISSSGDGLPLLPSRN